MAGFAWILLLIGAWITYAGYEGLNPLSTIRDIIKNPSQAAAIIAGSKKTPQTNGTGGSAVVAYARAQLGKPYRFGASGPDSFDCSGLTLAAYATVGIKLPHLASAQLLQGERITQMSQLQAGDLVFPSLVGTLVAGHVQIWTGSGTIIEAATPGTNVRERSPWGISGNTVRACRPLVKP